MDTPTATVLVAGLAAFTSFSGLIFTWLQSLHVQEVKEKVDELKKTTDGKMDQLLAVTGAAATAEGNLAGRAQVRADAKEDAAKVRADAKEDTAK